MDIKPLLGFALALCIEGCTSIRTTTLHCTSLANGQQAIIQSGLNRMLANEGFQDGKDWSFSPLWKGRADFLVFSATNLSGVDVYILYYQGSANANKAVVNAALTCVQSNAPNAA